MRGLIAAALALALAPPLAAQQPGEGTAGVVQHARPYPPFLARLHPVEQNLIANAGLEMDLGGAARAELEDHRRLTAALDALRPQRPGTVDAYVLSIALDSDPVFGREARAAAEVFARRFDAEGRTIVLAGPDGWSAETPRGTPEALAIALARIAELFDPNEDALVLYATAHGTPSGVAYHYGDEGYGGFSPVRLSALLGELGIANRLLVMNACFSGTFVPGLATETSIVISAAAADRTSFGCVPSNDWTYFGDAFVNRALRRSQPLAEAFEAARAQVAEWEAGQGMTPSDPRIGIGDAAQTWLGPLERRMPRGETRPTGRPSVGSGY